MLIKKNKLGLLSKEFFNASVQAFTKSFYFPTKRGGLKKKKNSKDKFLNVNALSKPEGLLWFCDPILGKN